MDTFRIKSDIESLISLTVQILDAARSGNPVLLEETVARRDLLVTSIEDFSKAAEPMDETTRTSLLESIGMVQSLDREIENLVALQHSKTLQDLRFLDSTKKQLLDESAVDEKGQRLQTHG